MQLCMGTWYRIPRLQEQPAYQHTVYIAGVLTWNELEMDPTMFEVTRDRTLDSGHYLRDRIGIWNTNADILSLSGSCGKKYSNVEVCSVNFEQS